MYKIALCAKKRCRGWPCVCHCRCFELPQDILKRSTININLYILQIFAFDGWECPNCLCVLRIVKNNNADSRLNVKYWNIDKTWTFKSDLIDKLVILEVLASFWINKRLFVNGFESFPIFLFCLYDMLVFPMKVGAVCILEALCIHNQATTRRLPLDWRSQNLRATQSKCWKGWV